MKGLPQNKGRRNGMKTLTFALRLVLASGAVLSAEVTPKYEVGLNYSPLHVTSANQDRQRTGNGGSGYFEYDVNSVLDLVADFGGYANTRVNDRLVTYMFGPRFNWRHSRLTPYVQFLFGGAYVWNDLNTVSTTQNAFALASGGGLDYHLTKHISIKPIQVEYVMTQIDSTKGFDSHQNDVRYSAGAVFRLGQR
jgi:opacity protein-like surface antigen